MDTKSELISIIIPVYNVEKYIERCVKSVLNQTYKRIEIILVDDGSTDLSGEICDAFAAMDNRVICVHQNNQGLGPARNAGLEIINGDYVAFVDSDDWLEPNTYEVLLSKMKLYHCDIATCGRALANDEGIIKYVYCFENEKVFEKEEAVEHYLLQKDMNMSACDKLYKASLFDAIRFPGNHLVSEDIVPIYCVIKKAERIILTGKPFYNYYYRIGSLSKSSFNNKTMGPLIYSKEVEKRVQIEFPQYRSAAEYFVIDSLISVYRTIRSSRYHSEEEREVYREIKDCSYRAFKNKHLNIRQKIYIILAVLKIDLIPNNIYSTIKQKWIK